MMTVGKQLNILAEKTYDLKRNVSEKDKQRRNQVVDLYGIDFYRESHQTNSKHLVSIWVSVSPDLVYYERFQYKLYVADTESTNFQMKVVSEVKQDDGKYEEQLIDITPYLKAQTGGKFIDEGGREKPYPNDHDLDEEEHDIDKPAAAYDLLEVAGDMYAEGNDELAAAILRPEFKRFELISDAPFKCALILYLKYSHLGR